MLFIMLVSVTESNTILTNVNDTNNSRLISAIKRCSTIINFEKALS